jgi:hypothetical protein
VLELRPHPNQASGLASQHTCVRTPVSKISQWSCTINYGFRCLLFSPNCMKSLGQACPFLFTMLPSWPGLPGVRSLPSLSCEAALLVGDSTPGSEEEGMHPPAEQPQRFTDPKCPSKNGIMSTGRVQTLSPPLCRGEKWQCWIQPLWWCSLGSQSDPSQSSRSTC